MPASQFDPEHKDLAKVRELPVVLIDKPVCAVQPYSKASAALL